MLYVLFIQEMHLSLYRYCMSPAAHRSYYGFSVPPAKCVHLLYVGVHRVCSLLDIAEGEVEAAKHKTAVTRSVKAGRDTCAHLYCKRSVSPAGSGGSAAGLI